MFFGEDLFETIRLLLRGDFAGFLEENRLM